LGLNNIFSSAKLGLRKCITNLQGKAFCNFERVFLGAPFALEDGIPHDVEGVRAA